MKGLWNGEPAQISVVEYEVTKSDKPLYWNNLHVGTRRQALQVNQHGQSFLIDNQFGDGYYKVTEGKGMWRSGHKSIEKPINVKPLPDDQCITVYDHEGIKKEETTYEDWQKENYPEEYKRLQSLKKTIATHQKNYPNG